jgi:hypothetical protein
MNVTLKAASQSWIKQLQVWKKSWALVRVIPIVVLALFFLEANLVGAVGLDQANFSSGDRVYELPDPVLFEIGRFLSVSDALVFSGMSRSHRFWAFRYIGSFEQPFSLMGREASPEEWEALFEPGTGLLHRVEAVVLSAAQLENLEWMGRLPQTLRKIQVVGDLSQGDSRLAVLRRFSKLEALQLSETSLPDVRELQSLVRLRSLDLSGNNLLDFSPLSGLPTLEVLNVSQNTQVDLASLLPLQFQLKELDVSGTAIERVSVLKSFKQLRKLSLRQTHVAEVEDLAQLDRLEFADFSDTWIHSVEALSALPRLQKLNLSFTLVDRLTVPERRSASVHPVLRLQASPQKSLAEYAPISSEATSDQDWPPKASSQPNAGVTFPALSELVLAHTPLSSPQISQFRKSHPECRVIDLKGGR